MIEIPHWAQVAVLVGIGLVILVVPIKVLWEMTRGTRDRTRRGRELADRLKEKFTGVRFERGVLGPHRIELMHGDRPVAVAQPDDDELAIRLEPKTLPSSHVLVRTRRALRLPFTILWESLRPLPRIRAVDPTIDESIEVFASKTFGAYLRDLAHDDTRESPFAESLVILNRLPGVKRFELRLSPVGGFRLWFKLRTEDLLHRPDDLESAIHHAFVLYDLMVIG